MIDNDLFRSLWAGVSKNESSTRYETPPSFRSPEVSLEAMKKLSDQMAAKNVDLSKRVILTSTPAGVGADWSEHRKRHEKLVDSAFELEEMRTKAFESLMMGTWPAKPALSENDFFTTGEVKQYSRKPKTATKLSDKPLTQIESDWI